MILINIINTHISAMLFIMPLIHKSNYSPTLVAPNSGIDNNTILMIHSSLTDSSSYHNPMNVIEGGIVIDSNIKKFNSPSLKFNNSRLNITTNPEFQFGTNDFSIDFWCRRSVGTSEIICGNNTNNWNLGFGTINQNKIRITLEGYPTVEGNITIKTNIWYHIALVKHLNNIKIYINGQLDLTMPLLSNFDWTYNTFTIGGSNLGSFTGWIAEFRVSNIARWLNNFIPKNGNYSIPDWFSTTSYAVVMLEGDINTQYTYSNQILNEINTNILPTTLTQVIEFDTPNEESTIGLNTLFDFNKENWSFDCWVNMSNLNQPNIIFCNDTMYNGLLLQYNTNKFELLLGNGTQWFTLDFDYILQSNIWYRIAIVKYFTSYSVFVDGNIVNKLYTPFIPTLSNSKLIIGNIFDNSSPIAGNIEDIRIFRGNSIYDENFNHIVEPGSYLPRFALLSTYGNVVDAELNTEYITSSVIKNLNYSSIISISGGNATYSLDGITYTNVSGPIPAHSTIWLKMTSANGSQLSRTTHLTIDTTTFGWTILTKYTVIDSDTLLLVNNGIDPTPDPVTGSGYSDRSIYNAPVTVTGNVTLDTPRFVNNSLHFNTGSVKFVNSNYNIGAGDFSIDFWAYRTGDFNTSGLFSLAIIGGSTGIHCMGGNVVQFGIGNNVSGVSLGNPITLPLNTWTHLAISRRLGYYNIFIDGILNASGYSLGQSTSTNLSIGSRYGLGEFPLSNCVINNFKFTKNAIFGAHRLPSSLEVDSQTTMLIKGNNTNTLSLVSPIDVTGRHPLNVNNVATTNNMTFNGYDSYISIPNHTDFTINNKDCTIECWVWWNGRSTGTLAGHYSGTTYQMAIELYNITSNYGRIAAFATSSTSPIYATSEHYISAYSWNHVAFQRTNDTFTLYINGAQAAQSVIPNVVFTDLTTDYTIGCATSTTRIFTGSIKQVRLSNIARYADVGFAPFTSDANTLLLAHCDDLSDSGTLSKTFESYGGSRTVDNTNQKVGSGCLLSSGGWRTTSTGLLLQSNFTLEMWANWQANVSLSFFSVDNAYGFYWWPDGRIILDYYGTRIEFTFFPTMNTWYHFAASKSGSTCRLYVNGIQQATGTLPTTGFGTITSEYMYMGVNSNGNFGATSYWDEIRISNTARYTATQFNPNYLINSITNSFTPPISHATDSNTLLLILGDTGTEIGVIDEIGNLVNTFGQANVNTSTVMYTQTLSYPANGSYSSTGYSSSYLVGSNNFTVECWIYINSMITNGNDSRIFEIISSNGKIPSIIPWQISFYQGKVRFDAGNYNCISQPGISLTTWHHITAQRYNNILQLFIDGVLVTTSTVIGSLDSAITETCIHIGGRGTGSTTGTDINILLEDIRFSNGLARYEVNFTPPTADYN